MSTMWTPIYLLLAGILAHAAPLPQGMTPAIDPFVFNSGDNQPEVPWKDMSPGQKRLAIAGYVWAGIIGFFGVCFLVFFICMTVSSSAWKQIQKLMSKCSIARGDRHGHHRVRSEPQHTLFGGCRSGRPCDAKLCKAYYWVRGLPSKVIHWRPTAPASGTAAASEETPAPTIHTTAPFLRELERC